jgi:hypothetical protein
LRSPTPNRRPAPRVVAAGLATALVLGACGSGDDVDALDGLQTPDGGLTNAGTGPQSSLPVNSSLASGDPALAGDGTSQAPGLPVASGDGADITQVTRPDGDTASTPSTAPTTTPTALTTATTQPSSTTQPPAANLPTNAVLDLASGSNVSFAQAAQGGNLPVLLWFWSPN